MNKLYVVGLGPGGAEGMTAAARAALDRAEQRALCRAMLQGCRWDGEVLTLTLCRL